MRGRESYAEPLDVYAAARSRGMDFVTISDHNTLNGSLAIAHLSGTFVSTEFDTWFPEDGCKVHVVALDLEERTFAEAERVRGSVHDLVACLREAGVVHYLAHPLFDMTGSLTADTVERMLLLFNVLEGRNGARVNRCNGLLREIVASLTPEKIADMAERQGVSPCGSMPWRSAMSAIFSGVRDATISRSRPLQRFTRAPLRPSRTLNSSSMRSTVSAVREPVMSNSGCAR